MARFQVIDPVSAQASLLEKGSDYSVYGLTAPIYADFMVRLRRLESLDEALGELPGTVLMGLVSTFDSFVADSVKEMFKKFPERYTSSEKEYKVKDVLLFKSFEEFVVSVIDEEVYQFTRGSHDEQVKFIEKNFDVPIAAHWKRYSDFIEVFERRNLIAHGERKFNSRYVRICKAAGHKDAERYLGDSISLSPKYLRQSADVLLEFAVILILSLCRKHDNASEGEAFEKINEIAFELIQSGRYRSASAIAQSALEMKKSACLQRTRNMLTVNLASAQKHLKQNEAAIKTLETIDWSASADDYQICVASIREDYEQISQLMPRVAAGKLVDADSFRTWPVFSFIRENADFQQLFEAAFGEKLVRVAEKETEILPDSSLSDATVIH